MSSAHNSIFWTFSIYLCKNKIKIINKNRMCDIPTQVTVKDQPLDVFLSNLDSFPWMNEAKSGRELRSLKGIKLYNMDKFDKDQKKKKTPKTAKKQTEMPKIELNIRPGFNIDLLSKYAGQVKSSLF
ncbi:MAG: hypothetical protein MJ252_27405 [archaeon]|nr:hypothetical protein [archaeon]